MWKKTTLKILWMLIGVGFLLVPVADTRPLAAIPLYPLDFVFIAIIILGLIVVDKGILRKHIFSLTGLVLGIFLLSAGLSWFVNGATLTGLGQLKSWLFLPIGAGMLLATIFKTQKESTANLLKVWFAGLVTLLVIVMPYHLFGITTFDGRLQGPFTSPNFLAFFLFPGILLSYYFWEQAGDKKKKTLFLVAGFLFVYLLSLTHSFGAVIALFGSFVWYFSRRKVLNQHAKKIALLVVLAGIFIAGELLTGDKLTTIGEERSSLASRLIIWEVSLKAIQDNPLFGIGIGQFQEAYLAYQPLFPPYLEWAVPQPHNLFLAIWLQAGLAGLIAFVWLLGKTFFQNTKPHQAEHILRSLFVGILAYGIFDTPIFGNALSFVWWTIFMILLFPFLKKEKSPDLL